MFLRRFRPGVTAPTNRTVQTLRLPAPIAGMNLADSHETLGPLDCLYSTNLWVEAGQLRSRPGSRYWVTNAGTGANTSVRTIIPFNCGTSASSKMFAASPTGIYDATSASSTPTQGIAFASSATGAGEGCFTSVTTIAGEFGLYCDEVNGYHLYTQATDTWSVVASGGGAGQISGVDPADLVFVLSWKNRVFFVERGTANVWYLPVGQITGTVTRFNMGSRLRKGGEIAGLWSMTIDGGAGIDDYLVVVSRAGEVLVWQGTDPDTADAFNLVGSWDIGRVPDGRRFARSVDGDVLVACPRGLVSVSRLRSGVGIDQAASLSRKVGPYVSYLFAPGFSTFIAEDSNRGLIFVSVTDQHGIVLSRSTGAWFVWNAPQGGFWYTAETFGGAFYFGGDLGVLKVEAGYDLRSSVGAGGSAVPWFVHHKPVGSATVGQKVATGVRTSFATSEPAHGVNAYYDYPDFEHAIYLGLSSSGGSSTRFVGPTPLNGTSGRTVAVAVSGVNASTEDAGYIGCDLTMQEGDGL